MNNTTHEIGKENLVNPPEALKKLSETARRIYEILAKEDRPIRSITIAKQYNMSVRTVRYNLSRLVEFKIACRVPNIEDMRSNYYLLLR